MEQDKSQKTEKPSQKKIADARKEGKLPMSREIVSFFILSIMSLYFLMLFPSSIKIEFLEFKKLISNSTAIELSSSSIFFIIRGMINILLNLLLLPLILSIICIILANIVQKGIAFTPKSIGFKLENISIYKGIDRLFSITSVVEFIKGVLKIILVAGILYFFIVSSIERIIKINSIDLYSALNYAHILLIKIISLTGLIVGIIGILDLIFQRYKYFADLMMTKEEVKRELKDTDGDQQYKAKLKSLRAKKMQERMMSAVPKADLVITNPTHFAIALQYNDQMSAPLVLAKGVDEIALIIKKIARDNTIPIIENPPLAQSLYKSAELNESIPIEYYEDVAKIIAEILKIKNQTK